MRWAPTKEVICFGSARSASSPEPRTEIGKAAIVESAIGTHVATLRSVYALKPVPSPSTELIELADVRGRPCRNGRGLTTFLTVLVRLELRLVPPWRCHIERSSGVQEGMAINEAPRNPQAPMIVCVSVSHRNTLKIAEVIGQELGVEVVTPEDADPVRLLNAELVGFGSGIFYQNFHPELREFVTSLPPKADRRAFVFASSGFRAPPWSRYTQRLVDTLQHKGFQVAGSFACRGWDTWLPFKPMGGHNKGRPDVADLDAARAFARGLTGPRSGTHHS